MYTNPPKAKMTLHILSRNCCTFLIFYFWFIYVATKPQINKNCFSYLLGFTFIGFGPVGKNSTKWQPKKRGKKKLLKLALEMSQGKSNKHINTHTYILCLHLSRMLIPFILMEISRSFFKFCLFCLWVDFFLGVCVSYTRYFLKFSTYKI